MNTSNIRRWIHQHMKHVFHCGTALIITILFFILNQNMLPRFLYIDLVLFCRISENKSNLPSTGQNIYFRKILHTLHNWSFSFTVSKAYHHPVCSFLDNIIWFCLSNVLSEGEQSNPDMVWLVQRDNPFLRSEHC